MLASAGNAAVGRLLQGAANTPYVPPQFVQRLTVQRDPGQYTPADPSAQVCAPEDARLNSSDPEVNGRTVTEVATNLGGRVLRYRRSIDRFKGFSVATQQDERDWYANLGLMGGFIDWFNTAPRTDPARWQQVIERWDSTAAQFDTALAHPITAQSIGEGGRLSSAAMSAFDEVSRLDSQYRAEYSAYLEGFSHSAEGVVAVSTTVRDIAFAAAVGIAVVVAAPVVAGALTTAGAGTLLTYGGTAVAMGGLGAGIEGSGQVIATFGAQASMALADLVRGSERAADNFDVAQLGQAGWEGMRRGFVDGVLAFAGAQAERLVASHVGQYVRAMLGPANSGLMSLVIRRSLTRAISGGATGSVIGALQAGLMAAINGQDIAGITAAMERGFAVGAAAGTALGAAGGAIEARAAHQLRQAVLPDLRAATQTGDPAGSERLFQDLQQQLAANPGVGSNDELARVMPDVWRALRDPDQIANALADVWLEEHLLGLMAPRDAASRYGQAAMVLSRRAGAPVRILGPNESFGVQEFYDQVVLTGDRFLDLAVLKLSPAHGASTHMIQDLVVDRVLRGSGMRAEQLRALFSGAQGTGGRPIGNDIWMTVYDSLTGGLNEPEVVYPIMARGLGGLQ
ncbi:hypothetical protein KIPE111705_18400 [Kibdelosporangium persicum]|uniref:Uncharacterized protein n=1 Tax=Kibdelosporangium persicum TaxID=2698649 RepID=A0ABX2FCL6_9PSEU|nr:hypothetical protein [Kibdelosporangium persicum]